MENFKTRAGIEVLVAIVMSITVGREELTVTPLYQIKHAHAHVYIHAH